MKKILVFLLLITGLVKGQVVIPKSTTTFSNIVATGNLRVNGSSTLTGAVTTSSLSSGSSLYLNASSGQDVFLQTNNTTRFRVNTSYGAVSVPFRIGSTAAPSASLDVTGTFSLSNQTFSVGTTNLTGGNSGTIAVLSDAVFPVTFMSTNTNPSDGTTYYFGNMPYLMVAATTSLGAVYLPYNCTLVGYSHNSLYTAGSAESATLAISGTTNYTLSTSITFSAAANYDTRSVSGLSQNFNAGDVINAKLVCPTYVTNPTFVHQGLTLWFVRRQ